MKDGERAGCGRVFMIGAFPPPVHGMSAVNAAMYSSLSPVASQVLVFDTSATGLSRKVFARLSRAPRALRGLAWLLLMSSRPSDSLYMSVSGGYGKVYELMFVLVARLKRFRIVLHHHCFSYLDEKSLLASCMFAVAGKAALHVVLSEGMGAKLSSLYQAVTRWTALSNAAFLPDVDVCRSVRRKPRVIGFLSNISIEKGVLDFLDLCAEAASESLPVQGYVAGPFQDEYVKAQVMSRLATLPNVTYVGPVYGAGKASFFSSIDALAFPTRYVNEAEPLTLHEAMQSGVPVIAYARGAIAEIVPASSGFVIEPDGNFVEGALAKLKIWLDNPAQFESVSRQAARAFCETRDKAKDSLDALVIELCANG